MPVRPCLLILGIAYQGESTPVQMLQAGRAARPVLPGAEDVPVTSQ